MAVNSIVFRRRGRGRRRRQHTTKEKLAKGGKNSDGVEVEPQMEGKACDVATDECKSRKRAWLRQEQLTTCVCCGKLRWRRSRRREKKKKNTLTN